MILSSVIVLIVGFLFALFGTPWVQKASYRFGFVAEPNHRSVHATRMPRLGGFAIFSSFMLSILILFSQVTSAHVKQLYGLLIGAAVIELVGILDDKWELTAKQKLAGQIIAAIIVVSFGLKIDFVDLPLAHMSIGLNDLIGIPVTVLWIVGVTNAMNLMDGLDGLAAGISAIASGTIMILSFLNGNVPAALLSGALLGSLLGFLPYNFYPARIFMGESGSAFLGFMLATLSIFGFKQATLVSYLVPLFILGVPLSDTMFAIIRRKLNKKPVFSADMGHLHHRLLQLGLNQKQVVLIIYGVSLFFALCAVFMPKAELWFTVVLTFILFVLLMVGAEVVEVFSNRKPILQIIRKLLVRQD